MAEHINSRNVNLGKVGGAVVGVVGAGVVLERITGFFSSGLDWINIYNSLSQLRENTVPEPNQIVRSVEPEVGINGFLRSRLGEFDNFPGFTLEKSSEGESLNDEKPLTRETSGSRSILPMSEVLEEYPQLRIEVNSEAEAEFVLLGVNEELIAGFVAELANSPLKDKTFIFAISGESKPISPYMVGVDRIEDDNSVKVVLTPSNGGLSRSLREPRLEAPAALSYAIESIMLDGKQITNPEIGMKGIFTPRVLGQDPVFVFVEQDFQ